MPDAGRSLLCYLRCPLTDSPTTSPVAIVTGAGSGIGREVALLMAGAGYRLVLVGRRQDALESTAGAAGTEARCISADLADARAADLVVDGALKAWDRVDALINNAGVVSISSIDQTTEDLLDRTFAVNTFAPARLVARLWSVFVCRQGGCVVNISSRATTDPFPGLWAYAAAKSALESLTRSIANEGRSHGIRAFAIAPGVVETPMLRSLWTEQEILTGQTLHPREVAEVVLDCVLGRRDEEVGRTIQMPARQK